MMVARREILNTEQVRPYLEYPERSTQRKLADTCELLRADRDALAEALRDVQDVLYVHATGGYDEAQAFREISEGVAKALAVHGSGEDPGA